MKPVDLFDNSQSRIQGNEIRVHTEIQNNIIYGGNAHILLVGLK